jgi:tetratricopeptide (TPR) repeat protein
MIEHRMGIFILIVLSCFIMCADDHQKNAPSVSLDSLIVYEKIVETLLAEGDTLKAIKILEKMLRTKSDEKLIGKYRDVSLAVNLFNQQINFLKELVTKKSNNANCHFGLGMAYIDKIQQSSGPEAGMLAGLAIEEFNKAIAIDSLHWSAHYALGVTYFHMPLEFGLIEDAINIFHKLIVIQDKSDTILPNYAWTYISLGDAYIKSGRHGKAIDIWEKGSEMFPDEYEFKKRLEIK